MLITIFTGKDINSRRALHELEKRKLPYRQISIDRKPEAMGTLEIFSGACSLPQVFFNARYIGGWLELRGELELGGSSGGNVANEDDAISLNSSSKRMQAISDQADEESSVDSDAEVSKPSLDWLVDPTQQQEEARQLSLPVDLPDGTKTSVSDITDKLADSLPLGEHKHKGTIYRNAFTGQAFVTTVAKAMNISRDQAILFGSRLEDINILCPVECNNNKSTNNNTLFRFRGHEHDIYRLQCHRRPEILNAYLVWNRSADICTQLVVWLSRVFNDILASSLDERGRLDYRQVQEQERYASFQEAVCELQTSDITGLDNDQMMAFGLNLYRLALNYANVKWGFCKNETDRLHLHTQGKLEVGGHVFTLQEWFDGILRGNAKASYAGNSKSKVPIGRLDRRRHFAVSSPLDVRVHFAVQLNLTGSFPFAHFSARTLDDELTIAARIVCNDHTFFFMDAAKHQIWLASMFKWYQSDFGATEVDMLQKIRPFLSSVKQDTLDAFLRDYDSNRPTITFMDCPMSYDLAINYRTYDQELLIGETKGLKVMLSRWKHADLPANENKRLNKVRSLNLLDTLAEERFDRLTRMVQEAFDVPVVFVTLVEDKRMWIKSAQWVGPKVPPPDARPTEVPREVSFCSHAILNPPNVVFVVPDATQDDRFADNPVVAGPLQVRFYAGCPLDFEVDEIGEKVNIGALCIHDFQPRGMNANEIKLLQEFAAEVKKEILRKELADLDMEFSKNVVLL